MKNSVFITLPFIIMLNACATTIPDNLPLIFLQSHTVGISVDSSMSTTTTGGGVFTFGYKDKNMAIVPVIAKQNNGDSTQLKGKVEENGISDDQQNGCKHLTEDALSVLGQFKFGTDENGESSSGSGGSSINVGLGKFFATGLAAKKLADGFASQLSGQAKNDEDPKKCSAVVNDEK